MPVFSEEDAERATGEQDQQDPTKQFFSQTAPPGIVLGYINTEGTLVIPAEYKNAGDFHEGLAYVMVAESEKYGYIEKTGEMVIEPQFDKAKDFTEGLACVSIEGKFGFIDPSGAWVIEPQYASASSFSEGFASVQIEGNVGFIDAEGETHVSPEYDIAGRFSEGLASVGRVSEGGISWGFIDPDGNEVLPFSYSNWTPPVFENGLALVQITERSGRDSPVYKSGYIDTNGSWVYEPIAGPWSYFLE